MTGYCPAGLPHSEIPGSKPVCGSPRLIAAYRVLRRLSAPRHPPCTLSSLTKLEHSFPGESYRFLPDSVVNELRSQRAPCGGTPIPWKLDRGKRRRSADRPCRAAAAGVRGGLALHDRSPPRHGPRDAPRRPGFQGAAAAEGVRRRPALPLLRNGRCVAPAARRLSGVRGRG